MAARAYMRHKWTDFSSLKGPLSARRIVVAMSGGVDSSVVAALAARTGAETIGVTLQLYDHGAAVGRTGSCCAGQDIRDARAVADRLGIAHYVFDYESRFRDSVIAGFADEYMAGARRFPVSAAIWASSSPTCSRWRGIWAPIASRPVIMSAG